MYKSNVEKCLHRHRTALDEIRRHERLYGRISLAKSVHKPTNLVLLQSQRVRRRSTVQLLKDDNNIIEYMKSNECDDYSLGILRIIRPN